MNRCVICSRKLDENYVRLPYPGGNGDVKEYCTSCAGGAAYEKYLLPDLTSVERLGTFLQQKVQAEEILMEIVEMSWWNRAFNSKRKILDFFKQQILKYYENIDQKQMD